jgi:predicted acyl esterase
MTPPPGSSQISDTSRSTGRNEQEDVVRMLQEHPHFDDYWQDKRAKVEQINLPAYVLASYSSFLHTFGSFRGFEAIQNKNKWYVDHVRSSDVSHGATICRPL